MNNIFKQIRDGIIASLITLIIMIVLFLSLLTSCNHPKENYEHYIAYPWGNPIDSLPLIVIPDLDYSELNNTVDTIHVYIKLPNNKCND